MCFYVSWNYFLKKDKIQISFPANYGKQGYNITLKFTADKVVEISKVPNTVTFDEMHEKKETLKKLGENYISLTMAILYMS